MKKTSTLSTQFVPTNIIKKMTVMVMLFCSFCNYAFSQCSLVCNPGAVQVSLDENCFATIEPDDILEGTWDPSCEPFTVVVAATGGNFVTGNYIGQTLSVTVTASGGNSCTGAILVSDYLAPIINCQPATISCFDDPATVNAPTATDNCDGNLTLTFTDQTQDLGCSGASYQIITRTYTATDASGNSTSCDQIINVTRPSLAQVVFPPNFDDLQEPALDCVNPNTSTSNTGVPTIAGNPINTTCDFAADFTDQVIGICQNSQKILRNWTVYDWCNSTNVTFTQTIKITDTTGPNLTCPNNVVISVNSNDCFGSLIVPTPNISDNCSSSNNITVDVDTPEGFLNGNTLFNLPIGIHTITYTATDDCDNTSTCTMTVDVIDEIPPVANCETFRTVGINNSGGTLVQAQTFDDGSYDNCGSITFEARRMDNLDCPGNDATPFSSHVPFYCCDIGSTVMVELRVTDESGNINSCTVEATAEDGANPIISCPPNVNIDCGENPNNLAITGEATATDNCNATLTYVDFVNTDNCGGGTISRTWTATDDFGNTASCLQLINLVNSTPYFITDTECNNPNPNDGVIWPCDFDTDACGPGLDPSVTGEPTIFEDFCDLVAVTYEDVVLPIQAPACVKILRTWLIVDWCQYDENTGAGSWTYTQVIKVLNSDDPIILSNCNNISFCSFDENCLEGPATLVMEASDDCTPIEDLNYFYQIDLNNDESFNLTGTTNDASDDYPLGVHRIFWHVEDGCGNISTCDFLFVIADCKNPTPNILNGIATEMMEDCMIEVDAMEWDNPSVPSFDNCGIQEWLVVSPSLGPGQTAPPASASPSWIFSGAGDLGTNTVDIWILDVNGNYAYVSTYILVQDNLSPFCDGPPAASISGVIETEITEPVENVTINISSTLEPDLQINTDAAGYYYTPMPEGTNVSVTPEKDINPLNGVSTFDLVLISKHILDIEPLDSPYKMIAADVNRSGTVSTIDLVQLRKVILFIDATFSENTSWRFVEADFVFPDPTDPFQTSFPEVFTVNGIQGPEVADFIAMKIGDVNHSAVTNDLTGGSDTRGSVIPYLFETNNLQLAKGEVYEIPVYADALHTMAGFQFSLELDLKAVEILNVETGNGSEFNNANLGLGLINRGIITGSWHTPTPLDHQGRATLFTIKVKAKSNAELIKVMKLTSTYTKAEAYSNDLEIMDLNLAFEEIKTQATLFQNSPNPFAETTMISFLLEESGRTALSIFDISGKAVFSTVKTLEAGDHKIEINKNDLSGAGLYFYQLQPEHGDKIIKKLVLTSRPKE